MKILIVQSDICASTICALNLSFCALARRDARKHDVCRCDVGAPQMAESSRRASLYGTKTKLVGLTWDPRGPSL